MVKVYPIGAYITPRKTKKGDRLVDLIVKEAAQALKEGKRYGSRYER